MARLGGPCESEYGYVESDWDAALDRGLGTGADGSPEMGRVIPSGAPEDGAALYLWGIDANTDGVVLD